jgi:hypothetical protein
MADKLQFKAETLTPELVKELVPLLVLHWEETTVNPDIPLMPNIEIYFKLQESGVFRLFTVRDEETNRLIGYSTFLVDKSVDHSQITQATCTNVFIKKENRGYGWLFLKWCDEYLSQEKVEIIHRSVKAEHDHGTILSRLGYKLVDHIYSRRLAHGCC